MPAAFPILRHVSATNGGKLALNGLNARTTHMNKTIDITGGKSLADIFTSFGKVVDKGRRKFTLSFDVISTLKIVSKGVQVNAEDKAKALASMSEMDRLVIASYDSKCKANAAARDTGETAERWSIVGTATLD